MPFVSLGLSPALCNPLAKLGYTTPTPVQLKSIPIVLTGRDLAERLSGGCAGTPARAACAAASVIGSRDGAGDARH